MTVKQSILAALEQNRGTALSGQALAEQLGVSRNAVWKAIHAGDGGDDTEAAAMPHFDEQEGAGA